MENIEVIKLELPPSDRDQALSREKQQIEELRDQGLSLREIAWRFDKSLSWVYSRVNEKYAPAQAKKPFVLKPTTQNLELFKDRSNGMSLRDIATKHNISVSTVHKLLYNEPDKVTSCKLRETEFREQVVVPALIADGHVIISINSKAFRDLPLSQRPDVLTLKDGSIFVCEVKYNDSMQSVLSGLGQLLLHRFELPAAKLVLFLPEGTSLPEGFREWLHNEIGITIAIM